MDKLTMDYAIRSSLARIIGHDIELSSFDRDNVISSLWRWISSPEDIHQTADTDELLGKAVSVSLCFHQGRAL